jgi:hypothetical protein
MKSFYMSLVSNVKFSSPIYFLNPLISFFLCFELQNCNYSSFMTNYKFWTAMRMRKIKSYEFSSFFSGFRHRRLKLLSLKIPQGWPTSLWLNDSTSSYQHRQECLVQLITSTVHVATFKCILSRKKNSYITLRIHFKLKYMIGQLIGHII